MKFLLLSLLTIAFHISYGATVDTITIQSKALQSGSDNPHTAKFSYHY